MHLTMEHLHMAELHSVLTELSCCYQVLRTYVIQLHFPKTASASCLLTNAPDRVDDRQLEGTRHPSFSGEQKVIPSAK